MTAKQQLALGLVLGLLLPPLSLWLILKAKPEFMAIARINAEAMAQLNLQLLTLGMLANGLAFFGGLRFNKEAFARGILFASLIWLIGIVLIKFFF